MSPDLEEAEEDERALELSTLSAIYPELLRDPSDPVSATIDIPVDPVRPVFVFFPPTSDGVGPSLPTPPESDGKDAGSDEPLRPAIPDALEIHELSHLPPVQLRIKLPSMYPNEQPPQLSLKSVWVPQRILTRLEGEGNILWEELGRSQVLFAYIDHLCEAAGEAFGFSSSKAKAITVSPELRIGLLDYDLKAMQAIFEKATYECGVCLEPKRGAICHRMNLCGHVFCVECLQDFYNTCIVEGDVGSVKCIAPKCGQDDNLPANLNGAPSKRRKRDRTLGPSELLQIPLAQGTVQRYVMLKRKNALESDRTTVYCPRQWCQGPARSKKTEALDRDEDLESDEEQQHEESKEPQDNANDPNSQTQPTERLAVCTQCTYAFCKVCKAGWHGDFYICDPKRKAKMTAEEEASEEYIKLHTSHCPTCNATSQKTHGCNHMICFKCSSHFCYLCSSWLDQNNPYEHFNNPKKGCFQRLWELEAGDGDDVGRGFAGGYESDGGDDGFDGQDDNPLAIPDDVDSDDEAFEDGPRGAQVAPPPRNHPHRQQVVVRLPPPPRIRAAIARRAVAVAAAAPAQVNDEAGQPPPEVRIAQAGPVRAPAPRPREGAARRAPVEGLQRFLQLVQNDEEDEWDSDELGDESDDDDFWQIPFR
ncbi:MAG: hypothetical protein L6R36_005559 [Xanthoria steineri]|nr:MAG: hypothetical protein L6R36_005559 [Xanthoria steineri]